MYFTISEERINMCGRINVSDSPAVQTLLDLLDIPLYPHTFETRFNIAPSANLFSVFSNANQNNANFMQWGMIPPWAKPDTFSRPLINARSESVWEKPSFSALMQSSGDRSQRIIIPINGFYEWQRKNKTKSAFHIHSDDHSALAIGGLYQVSNEGSLQCCIVTTAANETMSPIHDRMPVILNKESMSDWLYSHDKSLLDGLMKPSPASWITATRVSSYVNNASHEGEACIKPFTQSELFGDLFDK